MKFTDLFCRLWNFLKRPYEPETTYPIKKRLQLFFQLLVLDIPIAILLDVVIRSLFESLGIRAENYLYELQDYLSPGIFLLLAIPLLPFIEEVIFRFPLRYHVNPLFWFIYGINSFKKDTETAKEKTLAYWNKSYPLIFYTLLIVFVLLHLSNFDLSKIEWYLFPIFLLGFIPLFITGFFISYLRLTSGFFSGFLFHAAHNGVVFLIFLVFLGNPEKLYKKENNDYSISIEKAGSLFYDERGSYLSRDSISIKRYDLEEVIKEVDTQKAYISNKADAFNPKVNVSFYTKTPDNKAEQRKIILNGLEKAFGLSIETRMQKKQAFNLKVTDSARFQSLLTDTSSWSVYQSMVEVEMENAPISRIVKELNQQVKKPVFTRLADTLRLKKVKIRKTGDITKLNENFPEKYGLSLVETERVLPFYEIDRKNRK